MFTVLLPPGVNPTAVKKYINTNVLYVVQSAFINEGLATVSWRLIIKHGVHETPIPNPT